MLHCACSAFSDAVGSGLLCSENVELGWTGLLRKWVWSGLVQQTGPMSISVICALVVIGKITLSKRLLRIVLHLQCAFTLMVTAAFCVTWILLILNCSIMLHWTQPNPTH